MSINSVIIAALSPVTPEIEPDVYTGTATTYITFNYFTTGDDFADDATWHERFFVQVHFVCPLNYDSVSRRAEIKQKLFAAGFTWPSVTDATDSDGQHWIFECEYAEGL